jgi:hypothetical protein
MRTTANVLTGCEVAQPAISPFASGGLIRSASAPFALAPSLTSANSGSSAS